MTSKTIFTNSRVLVSQGDSAPTQFQQCLVIDNERIAYVGKEDDDYVRAAKRESAEVIDLEDRVVIPAFIDSHVHLLYFGLSLQKLDISGCKSLAEIRREISAWANKYPNLPRILCRGWHQPSTEGRALASMLDDLDQRPIYVEALDLHSTWCNSAALKELPLEEIKKRCSSTSVPRDPDGTPSGLLAEAAQTEFVWPFLNNISTTEEKQDALETAFDSYIRSGCTGAIDMAMDKNAWDALELYRNTRGLPLHIAAHWFIPLVAEKDALEAHIEEAIAMNKKWHPETSPDFCVVGIKLIADGVVDGCTAALSRPYTGQDNKVPTNWSAEDMNLMVKKAADAGLQVAIHAIGDVAITQAVDAIAAAKSTQGRHRIEHLELATEEDAKRLGALGITASVQPVHSDPSLLKAYPSLIGDDLFRRAFPYQEFAKGQACVAIGTDAPTSPHSPLPNLYVATTRKSAVDVSLPAATSIGNALTISQAFRAATWGAAYSRFAETWVGSLKEGLRADFVVLDTQWTPETLLQASVDQTWARGKKL